MLFSPPSSLEFNVNPSLEQASSTDVSQQLQLVQDRSSPSKLLVCTRPTRCFRLRRRGGMGMCSLLLCHLELLEEEV